MKVLTTESELTIKYKISNIEIELQNQRFLRVHRSFIGIKQKSWGFDKFH
ncbi:LytTR family transcriptional regulator DNA-binding domain-containing protein [Pedobacter cryoconitis]